MSNTQELKCACKHCGGRIAFPAGASGSTINCPHCGQPTLLSAPAEAAPATPPPPAPPASGTPSASLRCVCKHCGGKIAFPPAAAGTSINCPHCGKETLLLPSGPPPAAAAKPVAAVPVAAKPAAPAKPVAAPKPPPPPTEGEDEDPAKAARRKHFTTCTACGIEISVKAKACPSCGAPVSQSRRGLIIGIMVGVLVLLVGAFAVIKMKKGGGGFLGPKKDLEVVKFELQRMKDTSLVYVVGTIQNNSDVQHQSVRVDFNLFDKNGKQIGQASDYIMILEPKSKWDFKALVVEAEAATAKLDKITSVKQ